MAAKPTSPSMSLAPPPGGGASTLSQAPKPEKPKEGLARWFEGFEGAEQLADDLLADIEKRRGPPD